jgi:hypothetical protein
MILRQTTSKAGDQRYVLEANTNNLHSTAQHSTASTPSTAHQCNKYNFPLLVPVLLPKHAAGHAVLGVHRPDAAETSAY